ncbi:MAG: phosphoribosyltransferase family protein, partial [Phycisphaerae bacterium]|nr:phosphoribosyltransferase family protein [Phycisphaerae bacterium]
FMADLCRKLDAIPVTHDFLGRSSYGFDTVSCGKPEKTIKLKLPIEGKDVLIVEDIVDTGATLVDILDELKKMKPKSLKIIALLSKPSRRVVDVHIDYLGFEVPDKFLVGYGLDAGEKFRNLPYVGYIK